MYIDFEYKESTAYNTVLGLSKEELLYRMSYTEGAINFHIKEGNQGQVKFFTDELNLIKKRLKHLIN